jgi:hypothetical protein
MSPQDYYAAAIALFGIILFAKFVAHTRTATKWFKLDEKWSVTVWNRLHFCAVLAAILGAASCLVVLGWAVNTSHNWNIAEKCLRWVVAFMAGCSGIILALDIGITKADGEPPPLANAGPPKGATEVESKGKH